MAGPVWASGARRVVRCPVCRDALVAVDESVVCAHGHRFAFVAGDVPDLVGDLAQADNAGQWFMRFPPLVAVYERAWRPLFTVAAGAGDPAQETAQLASWLDVARGGVVVDLACGPGNTTRRLAAEVPHADVLGLDLSVPMLERAVADTPERGRVDYARADAHHLPLDDGSVDGVHCAAALYLLSEPAAVVREVARVLRPGGTFVGMTFVFPLPGLGRNGPLRRAAATLTGVDYLPTHELRAWCTDAGLERFITLRRGVSVLFQARRRH